MITMGLKQFRFCFVIVSALILFNCKKSHNNPEAYVAPVSPNKENTFSVDNVEYTNFSPPNTYFKNESVNQNFYTFTAMTSASNAQQSISLTFYGIRASSTVTSTSATLSGPPVGTYPLRSSLQAGDSAHAVMLLNLGVDQHYSRNDSGTVVVSLVSGKKKYYIARTKTLTDKVVMCNLYK